MNGAPASRTRQREWGALRDGETCFAPAGSNPKFWLFGGASTKSALFDLDGYAGQIVSDVFGDDRYFPCASDFWTAKTAAVQERAEAEHLHSPNTVRLFAGSRHLDLASDQCLFRAF